MQRRMNDAPEAGVLQPRFHPKPRNHGGQVEADDTVKLGKGHTAFPSLGHARNSFADTSPNWRIR